MIVLSSAWFISYVTDLLTCAFLILVCFPHLVISPKPGSRQWTSALNTSEQIIQCAQRRKETERTSEREQWKIEDDANNTARIYSSVCVCVSWELQGWRRNTRCSHRLTHNVSLQCDVCVFVWGRKSCHHLSWLTQPWSEEKSDKIRVREEKSN